MQVTNFVDEQSLKCGVEERPRLQPTKPGRQLVTIDEQSGEEEAAATTRCDEGE